MKRVVSMVFNCFDKNCFSTNNTSSGPVKSEILSNHDLAEELQKPIIRKFEKRKVPHVL